MTPRGWFLVGVRLIGVWLFAQAAIGVPPLMGLAASQDVVPKVGAIAFGTLVVQLLLGVVFVLVPGCMNWSPDGFPSADGLSDAPRQRDTLS